MPPTSLLSRYVANCQATKESSLDSPCSRCPKSNGTSLCRSLRSDDKYVEQQLEAGVAQRRRGMQEGFAPDHEEAGQRIGDVAAEHEGG